MFHSRASLLFSIIFFASISPGLAQSLDIGPLSIGNSKSHDGIRLNFIDAGVKSVNGINVTVWKSREENTSKIRGLAIGLPYTSAGSLKGFGIGAFAVVAEREAKGAMFSGLANIVGENGSVFMLSGLSNIVGQQSEGIMASGLANIIGEDGSGIMVSGLTNITGQNYEGMQFSVLGNIVGENYEGIQVGGIMNIAGGSSKGAQFSALMNINGENAKGIRASGLMNIAGESSKGLDVSGLMNITGEQSKGFAAAGLMNVSGEQMKGFSVAGIMNVSERISGFSIASANVGVNLDGIHIAALNLTDKKSGDLSGFAIAPFNIARYNQSGITVGLFNFAKALQRKGLQFGLINVVKSNPRGLRFLPLFNKNFR